MNPELGRSPIRDDSPAGSDPRQGEAFAALQAEMDRLTDLHAPGEPDWKRVAQQASDILGSEGKDLAVACWLLAAWFKLHRLPGLVAGVEVMRDLHQTYWEDMSPARLRGRRNQMGWLADWLTRTLDLLGEDEAPLDADSHARLLAAWVDLDAVWRERDEDGPSFSHLRARFQALPVMMQVESESESESQPEAQAVPGQAVTPEPNPDPSTASGGHAAGTAPADAGSPASATAAPPTRASEPQAAPAQASTHAAASAPAASPPPAADLAGLQTPEAFEQALDRMLDVVQPLLVEAVARFPSLAWPYRLNRAQAWATIDAVPMATDHLTRLPAPSQQDRSLLERLAGQTDMPALLQFTEACLPRCRFWLDLNYHSWRALSSLPDGGEAAAAVAADTAAFVARMPGLEALAFVDELPFAAPPTREWLAELLHRAPAAVPAAAPVAAPAAAVPMAPPGVSSAYRGAPADALALATAIAAASAQTESAHTLLAAVLERLQDTAQQVARGMAAT